MGNEKDLNNAVSFLVRKALSTPDPWLLENRDKHKGEVAFLLGGGPSLDGFDASKLDGQIVMSTNSSYLIPGLVPSYFITVSKIFWQGHKQSIASIPAERKFLPDRLQGEIAGPNISWLFGVERSDYALFSNKAPYSFSFDPSKMVFLGGSVIGVGLQILHWLGFETVVLLGVDHDWGINPAEIPETGRNMNSFELSDSYAIPANYPSNLKMHLDYHGAERAYELANEAYASSGRRIFNASSGSKLKTFELVDLDDFLQGKGMTNE